ncbi:MAG: ABC transporter ATP-binding protein [Gammaproteobacteria bacterium]
MNNIKLKLENISKSFFLKKVFENLSYEFTPGCYAIVGSNGAGKSTLLSIMSGSISSDSGFISINDINLTKHSVKAKRHISYVTDEVLVYPFMTGKELLKFICAAKKSEISSETEKLLTGFNIHDFMHVCFSEMSLGTQRKFLLAASTISNPDIYIFDEPTNAIEQSSREFFINYLLGIKDKKIIIFSTHDKELINCLNAKELRLEKHPIHQLIS